MELLGYGAFIIVGLTLGLIGGGGSILTVPILVYLLGLPADISTSYSLFLVGASALFGVYNYAKLGQIAYRTGVIFAVPSFIGVFLTRRFVMPAVPEIVSLGFVDFTKDQLILGAFGILMLFASVSMIRGRKEKSPPSHEKPSSEKPKISPLIISAEGLIVGAVTGFVGAGGGFLIIPALVFFAKLDIKRAVGTSLMIIAAKSLIGFTGDLGVLSIDWTLLGVLTALSAVGIILGIQLNQKIDGAKLKKVFGYFVLAMGIFIISKQIVSGGG